MVSLCRRVRLSSVIINLHDTDATELGKFRLRPFLPLHELLNRLLRYKIAW